MFTTKNARRVVIVTDSVLKDQFFEKIVEFGAKGYTYIECRGKTVQAASGDLFDRDELVRIEIVTTEKVAAHILDYVHATQFSQFGHYPLSAWVDTVEIDMRDESIR